MSYAYGFKLEQRFAEPGQPHPTPTLTLIGVPVVKETPKLFKLAMRHPCAGYAQQVDREKLTTDPVEALARARDHAAHEVVMARHALERAEIRLAIAMATGEGHNIKLLEKEGDRW